MLPGAPGEGSVRGVICARAIGLAFLCATQTERVLAGTSDTGPECSPVLENRGDCTSTLWTFDPHNLAAKSGVAAQWSFVPAAVRVRPSKTVTVTLIVNKRPLEKVQIQTTYNQVTKPDVLGTVLGKLGAPLGGFTLGSALVGQVRPVDAATARKVPGGVTTEEFVERFNDSRAPPDQKKLKERADFDSKLKALGQRQDKDESTINASKDVVNDLNDEIGAAQKYPPVITSEQWDIGDQKQFVECVGHILARIQGKAPTPESLGGCKESSKSKDHDTPLALSDLEVELALLKPQITDLPKELTALESDVKGSSAQVGPEDHQNYLALIARLTIRETTLEDHLKTLQAARETLNGYQDQLTACETQKAGDPCATVVVSKAVSAYDAPAKSGQQTASVKVSAQTLLTKESSDVGTVAVTFTRQPWEVSGGIMYSTVLGRSFQNSPVINAGIPETQGGKPVTAVTDATTKPTIDALVLVHWRFYEWQPDSWTRRLAILGSVGVGTGTNGSGADFAAGISFAYGNFFLSPLLHFTRDQRLTNGVSLGDNLMGVAPPTERYWVHKFGLAITYAVPIS